MERTTLAGLAILAMLGFIGWLGGGRKWAFRTMLSALILAGLGFAGILLYGYGADRVAEHRTQKIHDCAIAKVAKAECVEAPKNSDFPAGAQICPPYVLFDNPTPEQENAAVASAEEECTGEIDPEQKSLHEQISQYRPEHAILEKAIKNNSSAQPKGDD
jgi:hypothetical protein